MSDSVPSKIKILSEDLINKIAAGEVVDRPAAVVKELVENSIDAGADEITIVLKDGGKSLIRVVDNGSGMNQSDLLLGFQRHATSKISSYDDLTNINSLGFRGEALASIASVAQMDSKSVPQGASSGYAVRIEGGVMSDVEAVAGNEGTSISVKHLFYNTPARRKFLRKTSTEYRQIVQILNRFYLAYPEIAFTCVNEDEVVSEFEKSSLDERICAVLGRRIQQNMLAIENEGSIKIHGFIGNQDTLRRSRGEQFLYYNRRFFANKSLNYAVAAGYGDALQRGYFPVYLVFIEMDTEEVDVNVHPTKLEIKFANEQLVFSSIRGSVKRALTSTVVIPQISPWDKSGHRKPFASPQQETQEGLDLESAKIPFPGWSTRAMPETQHSSHQNVTHESSGGRDRSETSFERTNIWQVHNKYIISQIKNGLIVIDQHVAHERVLYEQALDDFESRKPSPQQLLFPKVVELSLENYSILMEMVPFLERIGFVVKAFGKNTIIIEGVPSGIKIRDEEKIMLSILDEYKRGKKENIEIRDNVAKSFACHSAVRAGDPMSLEAMNALIDDLFATREPYFCPHGRPVIIHIPLEELDRRFKRH